MQRTQSRTMRPFKSAPTRRPARVGIGALILVALALIALARPALAAQDPPPRHTVQPGDTLSALADQYASTVPAIMAANVLTDPDFIPVGLVLTVPPANAPVLRIEAGPDDTLNSIARRYHTTAAILRHLNDMEPRQRLLVGQDLLVPPRPEQPSPALPAGPLMSIEVRPSPIRQGETAGLIVHTSDALSLTAKLGDQVIPMRSLNSLSCSKRRDSTLEAACRDRTGLVFQGTNAYWGLAAIHVWTEPGTAFLDLLWETESGESGHIRWPLPVLDGDYPTATIVVPPEKGDLLDPDLVRQEGEKLAAIWASPETEPAWTNRFLRPIAEEYPTSAPFGQRRSYNGGPVNSFHSGQDFAAPAETPVVAPAAGTVVLAEPLAVRGNAVVVDHGAGLFTGYWHLSSIAVEQGQEVRKGDLLGLVGTTGLSTGAHLHWETRLHGIAVDPLQWTRERFP